MSSTDNPRLLARTAGVLYLVITACALFAYLYVRGQLVDPGNMVQTARDVLAHEQLYRAALAAGVIVALCNLPMGLLLYELLKVVNRRIALLALLFCVVAAGLEAVNLMNHFQTLMALTLPEYNAAFEANQVQALARAPIRQFGYAFSIGLSFFGVFCGLTGYLLYQSKFFPAILGVLMIAAGAAYLVNSFVLFLGLPDLPYILMVPMLGETALWLWLLIKGVNEEQWHVHSRALPSAA